MYYAKLPGILKSPKLPRGHRRPIVQWGRPAMVRHPVLWRDDALESPPTAALVGATPQPLNARSRGSPASERAGARGPDRPCGPCAGPARSMPRHTPRSDAWPGTRGPRAAPRARVGTLPVACRCTSSRSVGMRGNGKSGSRCGGASSGGDHRTTGTPALAGEGGPQGVVDPISPLIMRAGRATHDSRNAF